MSLETSPNVVLYQGEDKNIVVRLSDQATGDSFDLTGATEIQVVFPVTVSQTYPNGCLHKALTDGSVTILNAGGGKLNVRLSAAESILLVTGNQIGIEVRVTIAGFLTVVQIPNALSILPSLFPNC